MISHAVTVGVGIYEGFQVSVLNFSIAHLLGLNLANSVHSLFNVNLTSRTKPAISARTGPR
jgi:hypothetical protein